MLDMFMDALIDSVKLLPYLLITFLILELIEHKFGDRNEKVLSKNKKFGPLLGGLFGAFPQCGFSAMASNLFSSKVITLGTLVAVFLSTSDEMIPVMLGEKMDFTLMLKIVLFKVLVGITTGYIIDFIYRRKTIKPVEGIHHLCEEEHCSCKKNGIIFSSIMHTIKTGLFVLIANLLINFLIFKIGEDNLSKILLSKNIWTYFACSLLGLIPNCAPSVIMTELYLSNFITIGNLIGGLLTGSGLGILILFKSNKNLKENISVLSIIYVIGVLVGILVDLFI